MAAPKGLELCFGCQHTRADHPNDSGCQGFHTSFEVDRVPPSESEAEKEPVSDLQEEGPSREDDGRPSNAEGKGEMIRRYQEQHLCVGCVHVEVCEVGRHTAELFGGGWFVVISDCNSFEEG